MILPLRGRHRWMIAALALTVPPLFVAGLLARRPIPRIETTPTAVAAVGLDGFSVLATTSEDWGELPIRTTWLRDASPLPRFAVRVELLEQLGRPDLLVYWGDPGQGTRDVPGQAYLLGPIPDGGSAGWVVPSTVARASAGLILYSGAHGEVLGTAAVPRFDDLRPQEAAGEAGGTP